MSLYLCLCGKEYEASNNKVQQGRKRDCGCGIKRKNKADPTINTLKQKIKNAISRCYNPNIETYPLYGGRGITVCEEWRNDKMSFIEWALKNGYKEGLEIDRIDNDKGYSPDNCRFTTRLEQIHNRRPFKRTCKKREPTMKSFDWVI